MWHGGGAWLLAASVCAGCASPSDSAPPQNATAASADTELRDFQLHALEARVQAMPEGPERDYFDGMLAVRSGRFDDAIGRLNRALPRLRESEPKRAAMALQGMATAYTANNRYGDAAHAYAELAERFTGQLDHYLADDAAIARILSGTPPQTIAWN